MRMGTGLTGERVECAEVVAAVASAMLRYVLVGKPSELELRAADCGHGLWLHLTYPAWAAGAPARRGRPRSCSASIPGCSMGAPWRCGAATAWAQYFAE